MRDYPFIYLVLSLFLILSINCSRKEAEYTNPIIEKMGPADPDVFYFNGMYYLSCTDKGKKYDIWTSKDLVNWEQNKTVYTTERKSVWAPDFWYCKNDENFYLYSSENFKIFVSKSDSPFGRFEKQNYLVDAIDAHLFEDTDGKLYLYYVKRAEEIWARKMKNPTEFTADSEVFIMTNSVEWETPRNEGPFVIKRNGIYYMIYSGNDANNPNYAIGYATSDNPLGPFKKYENNPIAKRNDAIGLYGPGHGCAIQDKVGNYWYVYHQKMDTAISYKRKICIDPIYFDENGVMSMPITKGTMEVGPVY